MGKALDLTNQHFGRLVALYKTDKRDSSGSIFWHCKCDCGGSKDVRSSELKRGSVTSCGCKTRERATQFCLKRKIDLTGRRFGKLVVLEDSGERNHEAIMWLCKCDCGTIKKVNGTALKSEKIVSCGCIKSRGEEKISNILKENNIQFTKQKTFDNFLFPDTKKHGYFDFYVDNKYLIEYDGIQHFNFRENGKTWNNEENFIKTVERDTFKNQWCKDNNIPLIRIPYTHLNDLCIEDLLLETSSFIIRGENDND